MSQLTASDWELRDIERAVTVMRFRVNCHQMVKIVRVFCSRPEIITSNGNSIPIFQQTCADDDKNC